MEFRQFSVEHLVQILYHEVESLIERACADESLDILEDVHDELVDFALFVQGHRVGHVYPLVQQVELLPALQIPHLDVLM